VNISSSSALIRVQSRYSTKCHLCQAEIERGTVVLIYPEPSVISKSGRVWRTIHQSRGECSSLFHVKLMGSSTSKIIKVLGLNKEEVLKKALSPSVLGTAAKSKGIKEIQIWLNQVLVMRREVR
jgi:hypothetical protein